MALEALAGWLRLDRHKRLRREAVLPRAANYLLTGPLASFWGSVLVGVISGLAVIAIAGLARWGWMLRGKRQREQAQRDFDRIPVRVGLHQIAAELRRNADISARCWEGQGHVPSEARTLTTEEWPSRANEMRALLDENRALWNAIQATYDALSESRRSGGYPPKPEGLRALADECDEQAG